MSLRERLSLLTKLEPVESPAPAAAQMDTGFALPVFSRSYSVARPLGDLGLICREPALADYTWEQLAFVDTETTGLSTGSGTYVFLIGIGTFSNEVLTVRQYFLPSPALEAAFWPEVLAEFTSRPVLVSFNGKSYDLPLINTRLTLNGLEALCPQLHLDLLHPARRLWRHTLESCALQALERYKLDLTRQQDVPGAEIPAIYFDYIANGDRGPLEIVFQHNRQDIVSLFELAVELAAICSSPAASLERAEEYFGLAEAWLRAGDEGAAAQAIRAGLELPGGRRQKQKYQQQLARLYARQGRFEEALQVWEELSRAEPYSIVPLEEIAKLYEHRLKNLPLAWAATEQMLLVQRRRQSLGVPLSQEELAALERRRQRLARRLGKENLA
jgi:pentatricopeptide repeat protein